MELFSGLGWLWRALRGRSVTFAALFALLVLGFSVTASLRHLLHELHAPWLAWLLLPILIIAILAKKETDWLPDEEVRVRYARGLILGSLAAAVLAAIVLPKPPPEPGQPPPERVKHQGPASRR